MLQRKSLPRSDFFCQENKTVQRQKEQQAGCLVVWLSGSCPRRGHWTLDIELYKHESPVQLDCKVERALDLGGLLLQPVGDVGHGAVDHEGGCFVHLSRLGVERQGRGNDSD